MSPENKKVVETLSYQNTFLNSLEQFIHQEFINSGGGKAKYPDTWLADTIDKFYAPEPNFFSVFKHFIDTRRASESRKKHLMVDWRALKRFSIFRGEDITFDNLTSDTLRDFEQYLIKEHIYY